MQTHQQNWKNFQTYKAHYFVKKTSIVTVLVVFMIVTTLSINASGVQAQTLRTRCPSGDRVHIIATDETLGGIAFRHGMTWSELATHNHIAQPDFIYPHQAICIPGAYSSRHNTWHPTGRTALVGHMNVFPYPACTWWANQRYHQLHGVFVPWRTNSMAWQWTARARQFGWHISVRPAAGSIVDMQPWVQGAYGSGHVAVVERVMRNRTVVASSMNWGYNPYAVTYMQVRPGSGITFISQ